MRREQIRLWRDQQISDLSSIQRTQQQEEQLKTLILERDFERRAQMEEDEEEEADGQGGPETMVNGGEGKDVADQLVMSPPMQTMPQTAATIQPKSILKHNNNNNSNQNNGADGSGSGGSMGSPGHSNQGSPMKQPPKTASFSDHVMTHRHLSFDGTDQMNNNPVLTQLAKEMTHLTMSPDGTIDVHHQQQHFQVSSSGAVTNQEYPEYPPPPPERNSSYAFMSQQQQKLRSQQQQKQMLMGQSSSSVSFENAMNNNAAVGGMPQVNGQPQFMNGGGPISPTGYHQQQQQQHPSNGNFMIPPPASFNSNLVRGDNKRVSFHDEDNNNGMVGEGYSAGDLSKIREDPDVSGRERR